MKKTFLTMALSCTFATLLCLALYRQSGSGAFFSASIALGTTAYHLLMRLGVGFVVNGIMHNRADLSRAHYRCRAWERRLYELLRVKRWKKYLPTFDQAAFDHTHHSWEEIAQAMCQSEIVHEWIVLLSFLPIALAPRIGSAAVFVVTSVLAALLDLVFVILQRYNRPRILRLIGR